MRIKPVLLATLWCAVFWIGLPASARADNSPCWDDDDDVSRPDISCQKLTEPLLLSLKGASKDDVVRAMNAPGKWVENNKLHFISAYQGANGSGFVTFTFADGKVTLITASVEAGAGRDMKLVVNSARDYFCSDFPGSRSRCE